MGNGVSSPLQDVDHTNLQEDDLLNHEHRANGNYFQEDDRLDQDHASLVNQLMMIDTRLQPNDPIGDQDQEHSATNGLTPYQLRKQFNNDTLATERTRKYMNEVQRQPNITTNDTSRLFVSTPPTTQLTPPPQLSQSQSMLPLAPSQSPPTFETKGVSMRVIQHFASEIRSKTILLMKKNYMNPTTAATTIPKDNTKVSEMFELFVKPMIERFGCQSLVELTDNDLETMPTSMSASSDIQEATHYLVFNHDERFLDLASALFKRYGKSKQHYFWIGEFSLPYSISDQCCPSKYWLQGTTHCLSRVPNLAILFLTNDGFIRTHHSTDGSNQEESNALEPPSKWKRTNSLFTQIECLVPLAVAYGLKCNNFEIIQDEEHVQSMRTALLNNVKHAVQDTFSFIHSISLTDQYHRTNYFQAAGFFKYPNEDANEKAIVFHERHKGIDLAVMCMMNSWLLGEARSLLVENIKYLDLNIAKGTTCIDFHQLYNFCSQMATLLWASNNEKDMKHGVEILMQVLRSANETYGTLSSYSMFAATNLIDYMTVMKQWDQVEPLLVLALAHARSSIDDGGGRGRGRGGRGGGDNDDEDQSTVLRLQNDENQTHSVTCKIKALARKLGTVLTNQARDEEAYVLLVEGFGPSSGITLNCLKRRGDKYWNQNNRKKARTLYGEIIANCNKETSEHSSVLHAASRMADYLKMEVGDRAQALTLYRRICIGQWNQKGPFHALTVVAHRKTVILLFEDRDFIGLVPYLQVVDSASKHNNKTTTSSTEMLQPLEEEVQWCKVRGDYYYKIKSNRKESFASYRRGLFILDRKEKNRSSTKLCTSKLAFYFLSQLGSIEQEQVHVDEAKVYYKRYLTHCINNETKEALLVANNLAWVYTAEGLHSEAEPLFRHHYVTQSKLLGDYHALVNRSRARLASCLDVQGRRDESFSLQNTNSKVGHFQQTEVVLGTINKR